MNVVDALILAACAIGLIVGLRSGFVKQVFGFLGLLVALLAGIHLMDDVGVVLSGLGVGESIAPLCGFAIVFVGVHVVVFILVRVLETILGTLMLSPVNRVLGSFVGGLKACLALSILFLILGYINVPSESARAESRLYGVVAAIVPNAWDYVQTKFPEAAEVPERIGKADKHREAERPVQD